jgi:hypothetical protein
MLRRSPRFTLAVSAMLLGAGACANASPDDLAEQLQAAFASGDLTATAELAELDRVPPFMRLLYLGQATDCATYLECSVTTEPLDEEFTEQMNELEAEGLEMPAVPEGFLVVNGRSGDGRSTGDMKVPYAKVGGTYKVVSPRYTDAALAKLRATTNEELVEGLFAAGIYDPELGEHRTDWATAATKLPPDGGAAGEALRQHTAAMAAAIDQKDPDLAMRSGGMVAAALFSDAEFDGSPIPRRTRELNLERHALKAWRDVDVLGGYALGSRAVLIVEARNGMGWIERGAAIVGDIGDGWEVAGTEVVSYPE